MRHLVWFAIPPSFPLSVSINGFVAYPVHCKIIMQLLKILRVCVDKMGHRCVYICVGMTVWLDLI